MTSTMDTAATSESWLNKKDVQDGSLQTAVHPSCLRRPIPKSSATVQTPYRDRDWTNPNRFSDPLHRSSRAANFPCVSLPSRPNKAYTWYLDNELPLRRVGLRSNRSSEDRQHSLFAPSAGSSTPVISLDDDLRRKRRNGASFTWERVQQHSHAARAAGYGQSTTLDMGTAAVTAASGRVNPHLLTKRAGFTPLAARPGYATYGYGSQVPSSQRSSPCGSQRSCPSPNSLGNPLAGSQTGSPQGSRRSSPSPQTLGSHLATSPCGSRRSSPTPYALGGHLSSSQLSSPCSSQRSSPNRSPQGTMTRLSPSLFNRSSAGASARLSPTQHSVALGVTLAGALNLPAQVKPSRPSSFVSQWVSASPSPSFRLSPCSARSSHTSSGRDDDVSFGSETDDDFFYVSCQQLSKGLADLTVNSTAARPFPRDGQVLENPSFAPPVADGMYMEEDDFDGCSDDALSDDVFLDDPQPLVVTKTSQALQPSSELNSSLETKSSKMPVTADGEEGDCDNERMENDGGGGDHDTMGRAAVESLRRNSLQSRLRQTWRHRRHKAAHNAATVDRSMTDTEDSTDKPLYSNLKTGAHVSPSYDAKTGAENSKSQSSTDDEGCAGSSKEVKPCFYYVISPTDDVNMPDVIAVRRSSVELIRWQNSLRRRRRRQAKRHDLGRSKKKEPKQSATV